MFLSEEARVELRRQANRLGVEPSELLERLIFDIGKPLVSVKPWHAADNLIYVVVDDGEGHTAVHRTTDMTVAAKVAVVYHKTYPRVEITREWPANVPASMLGTLHPIPEVSP